MAFALRDGARLSLLPALAGTFTARQASLDAADRSVASPEGLVTLDFDPTRFPVEPPVCYRASWQLPGPDFHRQATTSFIAVRSATHHLQLCWAHEESGLGAIPFS